MTSSTPIRVLIAEDDAPLREVMTDVILSEPTFELVGAVGDAESAIAAARAELPDVVILDVRMPGGGGVAATRGIRRVSTGTSVIAFTGHDDESIVAEMLDAGVTGYLLKGSPIEEIVQTIHAVAGGRLHVPS